MHTFLYRSDHEMTVPMQIDEDHPKKEAGTEKSLEAITKPVFRSSKRTYYSLSENRTISRMNTYKGSCFEDISISSIDAHVLKDLIHDHATRRVLLFYHLALAYYKQGCKVELINRTTHQHGMASCGKCDAAHSSILTNFKDNFFDILSYQVKAGISEEVEKKLLSIGMSRSDIEIMSQLRTPKERLNYPAFSKITGEHARLIPVGRHLYDNLNSTVEILRAGNQQYDSLFEQAYRRQSAGIISECSEKGLHPYTGLKKWLDLMNTFFKAFDDELVHAWQVFDKIEKAEANLHSLLKQTVRLEDDEDKQMLSLEMYLNAAADLHTLQVHYASFKLMPPLKLNLRIPHQVHAVKMLHHESSNYAYRISRMKGHPLFSHIEMLASRAKKFKGKYKDHLSVFKDVTDGDSDSKLRERILKYTESLGLGSWILFHKKRKSDILNYMYEHLETFGLWRPISLDVERRRLKEMEMIHRIQKEATILPCPSSLSGKLVKGKRHALTEDELIVEQVKMLRRQFKT